MVDKINYLETETEKFPLVFTLNVMESIQEKYGTIEAWSNLIQRDGEPDIKALKFFITEAINERNPGNPRNIGVGCFVTIGTIPIFSKYDIK